MKKKIFVFLVLLLNIVSIKNIYAETYDGEYSVEYLLKNYNAVTLGKNDNSLPNDNFSIDHNLPKGNISRYDVEGAVLINGDYTTPDGVQVSFGQQSGNIKSYVKGEISSSVTPSSQLVTDSNYIDFEKMYKNVLITSQAISDNAENYITGPKLEVSSPGIYTINNAALGTTPNNFGEAWINLANVNNNTILIKNYDKNSLYIFNYYNEYLFALPKVMIIEPNSSNSISLIDYVRNGNYTGNVIFNCPNAKYVRCASIYRGAQYISDSKIMVGNIIAPKALVEASQINTFYGTIISNSITTQEYYASLFKANYTLDKKIIKNENDYYVEPKNYEDDYYTRDYSIKDLLENYNLITLGHKEIDSKSRILEYGNTPGSVKLFHITGQALIGGDLYGKVYDQLDDYVVRFDDFYYSYTTHKYDKTLFDLESNKVTESYIKGSSVVDVLAKYSNSTTESNVTANLSVIQPWDNMANDNIYYKGKSNTLFDGSANHSNIGFETDNNYGHFDNYLNFDRLYDNIVSEQECIKDGEKVSTSGDTAHIAIGGNYYIEDINELDEIIFDNFEDNKDKITIITIKNTGDINFPLISKNTKGYKGIPTNDYFGKESATHLYEVDTFITNDEYYGNIIWNIPNGTYIKLKENAPFIGHMIAPNADVETPELHFAGCFIVNSIYGEGNTEAHFYPVTAFLKCDCDEYDDLDESQRKMLSNEKISRLLGGEGTTIEKTVIGDEEKYQEDMRNVNAVLDNCEDGSSGIITELLTNPKTYRKLGLILLLLIPFSYILLKQKRKVTN